MLRKNISELFVLPPRERNGAEGIHREVPACRLPNGPAYSSENIFLLNVSSFIGENAI